MIDLKFGLFWSGGKMSYLRYLTFVSLRKFHPEAPIELYVSDNYSDDGVNWLFEKQDFQNNHFTQTVELDDLQDLEVEIKVYDKHPNMAPNFQSDFFRWWWLKNNGGFYLDTDQIILKPFDTINRNCDFIYSEYQAPSCGTYAPVGVVGGTKDSEIISWINDILPQYYASDNYNSLGPCMLKSVLHTRPWKDHTFNTGYEFFYPAKDSCYVSALYCNMPETPQIAKNAEKAYAIHWFGGHKASQAFNKKYSEHQSQTSLDLISYTLRDRGIV